jgi:hypothetical protein
MAAVRVSRLLLASSAAAILLTACGGNAAEPSASPATPLPSGSLGVVTADAASAAVLGLCDVRSGLSTDPQGAAATFENEVHEELHVIAAATEVQDREAAATLLQAKEKVEADFADPAAGGDAGPDVEALLSAVRSALTAIGLSAPDCPA